MIHIYTVYSDIDECALGIHECDQVCRDSPGSYACGCNAGYNLNTDGFTCMTSKSNISFTVI